MSSENDFLNFLGNKVNDALKKRGRLNIIIAGATGVGKSTLINAVFQGNLADTGIGKPVTLETKEKTKEGIPISIFDTQGLEKSESYRKIIEELDFYIQGKQSSQNAYEHIHIAWVCIVETTKRVQGSEIELVEMLSKHKIPVIAVITQCISDEGFKKRVEELLPQTRITVRVHAKETILEDGDKIKAKGLEELIERTMDLVPESVRDALAAAQRISLKTKQQRAHLAVSAAMLLAIPVGVIPIVNIPASIAVRISMLISISAIWGLSFPKTFFNALFFTGIMGAAGVIAAPTIISTILKLIPGIGYILSPAMDSLITSVIGEAYIGTLSMLTTKTPDRDPTADEVQAEYPHQLQKQILLKRQ
jgi:predicted GTPase